MATLHTSLTRYLTRGPFEDTPQTLYYFACSWGAIAHTILKIEANYPEKVVDLDSIFKRIQTAYLDGRVWFGEYPRTPSVEEVQFAEMVNKLCDINGVPRLPPETIGQRGMYHDACRNIPTMEGWFLKVGLNALVI